MMATFGSKSTTLSPHRLHFPKLLDLTDPTSLNAWLKDVHSQSGGLPLALETMLCDVCSQIQLDTIFSPHSQLIFRIGNIFEVQSRQHCSLCRLCKVRLENLAGGFEHELWLKLSSSCNFGLASVPPNYAAPPDDDAAWHYTNIPLDIFLGPTASLQLYMGDQFKAQPLEFLIQHRLATLGPSQLLVATDKGRFLSSVSLQRILRGALECKQNHRSCDGTTDLTPQAFTFRLIDVQDQMIRPADQRSQYVALSYMWGQLTRDNHYHLESLPEDPSIQKLPETLPQTIKDVLQVTRWLGLQYVWIDAYCIDQNNPLELQKAIQNMDTVYENALLTICSFWADSDAGLHGVSVPFKEHNSEPLGENYVCSTFSPGEHPLDYEIVGTPWHSRGWIFQESILSRQRLCFMPSSIMLLCQQKSISSHYYTRIRNSFETATTSDIRVRQCLRKRVWDFGSYEYIVRSYTIRTLSHPGDALDAIRGILNRISKMTGMEFAQALPQANILSGLMWTHDKHSVRNGPKVDYQRQYRFPSWSWLDYYGEQAHYTLWLNTHDKELVAGSRSTSHTLQLPLFPRLGADHFFSVKVPKVAEISTNASDPEPTRLTIISEVAEVRITNTTGFKCDWRVAHPRSEAFMDSLHSWLTRESPLSDMCINSQTVDRLGARDGMCQVSLVLLAQIFEVNRSEIRNGPFIGNTVIAMAITRLNDSATAERLGIIAVPYTFWVDSNPKYETVDLV
ncbi:heterokaryon incompatibility protein-domain-containing protein [Xylariaceae sp. AK1471]|nr:heterokaryon incompatibility protein-domain-containing protein [Xylariaceae sp. AK1471]